MSLTSFTFLSIKWVVYSKKPGKLKLFLYIILNYNKNIFYDLNTLYNVRSKLFNHNIFYLLIFKKIIL